MDSFLSQSRQDGELVDRGLSFTLSGERARQQILASIPPDENRLFRGLMYLSDALIQMGVRPPEMRKTVHFMPHPMTALGPDHSSVPLVKLGREWFKERFERPFTSSDRLAQDWDRGWLRLISRGVVLSLCVCATQEAPGWGFTIDLKRGFAPLRASLNRLISQPPQPAFKAYLHLGGLEEMPRDPSFLKDPGAIEERLRFGRNGVYRIENDRGLYDLYLRSETRDSWFRYRTQPLALYERLLIGADKSGGMSVSLDKSSGRQHLGEGLWLLKPPGIRFTLWAEPEVRIFARRLVGPPELWSGIQVLAAYFTVALDEAPAKVDLFDRGHSIETRVIPSGPPGLLGVVCCPELQLDLWGTKYVRNAAWERAMTFLDQQMEETWADLGRLSEPLKTEILKKRTKRAYRRDVAKKLDELWFTRGSLSEAPGDVAPE